jgi:hypothetical protein
LTDSSGTDGFVFRDVLYIIKMKAAIIGIGIHDEAQCDDGKKRYYIKL